MPRYQKEMVFMNRLIHVAISRDLDGWDCGLFSAKKIAHPSNKNVKAIRLTIWMLAVWIGLQKVRG